jgi:hypothetical protein
MAVARQKVYPYSAVVNSSGGGTLSARLPADRLNGSSADTAGSEWADPEWERMRLALHRAIFTKAERTRNEPTGVMRDSREIQSVRFPFPMHPRLMKTIFSPIRVSVLPWVAEFGWRLRTLSYQMPPRATVIASPFTPPAASLQRNAITCATSSGSSTRFWG